jgi:hypothetical protein
LTANQIEQGELADTGKRVRIHLAKANQHDKKAKDHWVSAACLLAEAKTACTEDGFETFHLKFCPELGRSRTYELLAIASGTKSVEQIQAETCERVARHRAKASSSVTVTDSIPADNQSSSVTVTDEINTDEINSEPAVTVEAARDGERRSRRSHTQVMRERLDDIISARSIKLTLESRVDYVREHGTPADFETLRRNIDAAVAEIFSDADDADASAAARRDYYAAGE